MSLAAARSRLTRFLTSSASYRPAPNGQSMAIAWGDPIPNTSPTRKRGWAAWRHRGGQTPEWLEHLYFVYKGILFAARSSLRNHLPIRQPVAPRACMARIYSRRMHRPL